MSDLTGRVALVTGSSRGIGAAIALVFARAGAAVAVHGRDEALLSAVRTQIEDEGGRAIAVAADVTHVGDVEAMTDRIQRELGPVDVLVANAGGSPVPPGPIENISVEDWRASVEANLTATFLTVRSVLPDMKRRGRGVIITMASAASRRPHPSAPVAYAAAKAGIEIFTQNLAEQAGPYGVRANCIAPGTILTERTKAQIPPDVKESLREHHPARRLGVPDDIARAALFLASDDSDWITGVVLDVAGGAVMV